MTKFIDATTESVFKSAFLYIRNTQTQQISKVVAASDFQVGLTNLPKDLTVTGKAIFTQGISLVDNTPYLIAGSNITITTAPNGQVTIATTGAAIGDVEGPASATDNAIVRFNLTTGKLIQNSGVTIDDSNNITTAGDIAVNGGDLTSNVATFNLLNSTVTTLNVGGAATTIEIGAATGTTSINNALTVDGDTTLGNATSDTVTINGTTTFAGSAVTTTFNGDIAINGGDITTTAPTMNLVNAATTINLGSTAIIRTTNIATGAAAQTVTLGSTTGTSSLTLNAGSGNLDLGVSNAIRSINIGTGTSVQTIGIGTGAAANAITIGSNAASIVSINGGDALNLYADGGTITIDAGGAGANAISVGTFGYAQTISVGNTTGATSLAFRAGSGGITFETNITASGDLAVNGGDLTTTAATMNLVNAATTINLGSTAVTRAINIGTNATNVQTIGIGTGNAANAITIGSNAASIVSINGGDALNLYTDNGSLTIDSSTGNINIGTFGYARTTDIATGAAVQTVTLGSTTGASSLTLQAGTGNIGIGISQSARTITIGPISTNIASAITHTVNIGYIPDHISAITNVNIGTAGAGSTKNVITIGNYSSTAASTTVVHGDELTLGSSGKKIGFFGTAPTSRTGAGLTTTAQLYTALRALGLLAPA